MATKSQIAQVRKAIEAELPSLTGAQRRNANRLLRRRRALERATEYALAEQRTQGRTGPIGDFLKELFADPAFRAFLIELIMSFFKKPA